MDNTLIQQIQNDILNPAVSIETILLKAKVLAHTLKNEAFRQWVKKELDGYSKDDDLPDYRKIYAESVGYFASRYQEFRNVMVPTTALPEWMHEMIEIIPLGGSIRSIEELSKSEAGARWDWPGEWIAVANQSGSFAVPLVAASRNVSPHVFAHTVTTVRSRLQDFVLELSDLPWATNAEAPAKEAVERLVQVTIYNNSTGGNVTTFNQQGQSVSNQYNAGRDIKVGAVQTANDLVELLGTLQVEIASAHNAGVIVEDVAVEADYQLKRAALEAKKEEPDKKSLLDHIGKAKALLEDAKAATSLVTALMQAAEVAGRIFQ